MKKTDRSQKEKKPSDRIPEKPKDVIALTDQDLEQVQGGLGGNFRIEIGGLPAAPALGRADYCGDGTPMS